MRPDTTAPRADPSADSVASVRIAGALRAAILGGDILPGQRLRQDDIAARFAASRLPVREALRMLHAEGLVELTPNRSARVPVLSLQDVNTHYRMRERLEPLTLVESMEHLTDDHVAEMATIQDEIERNTDVSHFLMLDRNFHMASYAACPSAELLTTTVRLWNATQHYRRAFMSLSANDRAVLVNAEHRLLLDAIRRRDPVDAERFLAGHIRRTRVELTNQPGIFEAP